MTKPTPEEKCLQHLPVADKDGHPHCANCGRYSYDHDSPSPEARGEKDKCSNCGKTLSDCDYSCYYQDEEARVDWEKEAREILTCKKCDGSGWYVGSGVDRCGEEEQIQVQCDNCYQGQIASYGVELIPLIAKALSAAFEKGREAR